MSSSIQKSPLPGRERAMTLATGLGWFSIGLGLAELLAPRTLNRTLGTGDHDRVVRGFGLREIGAGLGILSRKDPEPWIWARVAGDALDLAALVPALGRRNRRRTNAAMAFGNVAAVTALDIVCGLALSRSRRRPLTSIRR